MKKIVSFLLAAVVVSSASVAFAGVVVNESGIFDAYDSEHVYHVWYPSQALTETPSCYIAGSDLDLPEIDSIFDACGDHGAGVYTLLETVTLDPDCANLDYYGCLAHENFQTEATWESVQ